MKVYQDYQEASREAIRTGNPVWYHPDGFYAVATADEIATADEVAGDWELIFADPLFTERGKEEKKMPKITIEHEVVELYREPCDCGNRILHNNGGNYHRLTLLHVFSSSDREAWCVVLESTNTREDFPQDEHEHLILDGGGFRLLHENERNYNPPPEEQEFARFRYGEARVLDWNVI
jgi:hypothetical protein